ncbi:hypothetical protein GDO86_016482 [Hymenochirus boettgeri]|uniref:Protein kinase domain-containing protein n=1 Tax=Hymenochirus boettgeri TaxID=247094 RepID=A0A8T2K0H7_9PIPI|nr:hypothetical protein GDO86_016482 [Hymenochirus boettgeri]KAG8449828.1 hypothetical protein GDO86_016482 [Hymenochirus boettgeri]
MKQFPAGDLEGLEPVGRGGFGVVYRGWSRSLNMEVALKTIQGAQSSSINKLIKDLMKETEVMERASNPYVLRLLGIYERTEGDIVDHGLVMEYMPNGSLRNLFDSVEVPWALRYQILHQIVLGMNYLHSLDPPIIHRDLKPSNVLLNKYLDVQITDFGLSKFAGATTSASSSFAGTLAYMPPEALIDLDYKPTKAYDVYSFGILAWTIFSGEEPYFGAFSQQIYNLIPIGQRPKLEVLDQLNHIKMVPEARALIIQCWSGNAAERPSFYECSQTTRLMFEEHSADVEDEVRIVKNRYKNLKNGLSKDEDYDSDAEELLCNNVLAGLREDYEEPQTDDEEVNKTPISQQTQLYPYASPEKEEEEEEEEEEETPEKVLKKAINVIGESAPYKNIVDNFVEISNTVKQHGQGVGKGIGKVVSSIKNLWN